MYLLVLAEFSDKLRN